MKLLFDIVLYTLGGGFFGLAGSFVIMFGFAWIMRLFHGPYPPGSDPGIVISMLWGLTVGPGCAFAGAAIGLGWIAFKYFG